MGPALAQQLPQSGTMARMAPEPDFTDVDITIGPGHDGNTEIHVIRPRPAHRGLDLHYDHVAGLIEDITGGTVTYPNDLTPPSGSD